MTRSQPQSLVRGHGYPNNVEVRFASESTKRRIQCVYKYLQLRSRSNSKEVRSRSRRQLRFDMHLNGSGALSSSESGHNPCLTQRQKPDPICLWRNGPNTRVQAKAAWPIDWSSRNSSPRAIADLLRWGSRRTVPASLDLPLLPSHPWFRDVLYRHT